MDKKLLIMTSICAMVLLLLGSLSNVVGYQSVKSATNDSPLFQTRTQRVTNSEQKSIKTQYLGNGYTNQLQFPLRETNIGSLIKVIEIINQMDNKTITRFTEFCIQKIKTENSMREMTPLEIQQSIYLLKTRPQIILNSLIDKSPQDLTSGAIQSICHDWFPGCIPISILRYIFESIIILISIIYFKFISYCSDTYAPCGDMSKMQLILGK